MVDFNVICEDNGKVIPYNIMPYLIDRYKGKKNKPKTFDEFKEFIKFPSKYICGVLKAIDSMGKPLEKDPWLSKRKILNLISIFAGYSLALGGVILNIPLKNEVDIDFNILSVVEILFLYSMSLVFEYGHEIQLDSKGKMYGEEN